MLLGVVVGLLLPAIPSIAVASAAPSLQPGAAVQTTPMNIARSSGAVATTLRDGRVLVVGGGSNTSEVFDPADQTWTETSSAHTADSCPSTALLPTGDVFVLGKVDGEPSPPLPAEIYHPGSNSWSTSAPPPQELHCLNTAALPNGDVLVADRDSAYVYDPVADSWRQIGAPPLRSHSSYVSTQMAELPGGNILLLGDHEDVTFNASALTWSKARAVPAVASGPLDVTSNGDLLSIGGTDPNDSDVWTSQRRDAATGQWSQAGAIPDAGGTGSVSLPDGVVVAYRFYDSQHGNYVEVYDPTTGLWSDGGTVPRVVVNAAPLHDGSVLLMSNDTTAYLYEPPTDATSGTAGTGASPAELTGGIGLSHPTVGENDWVTGHLVKADSTDPIPGETVTLYGASPGGTTWNDLGSQVTNGLGAVRFQVQPNNDTLYLLADGSSSSVAPVFSQPIEARPQPDRPPDDPQRLDAEPADSGAVVFWAPPIDDGGSPITSYRVSIGGQTQVFGPNDRTATFGNLDDGTTYQGTFTSVTALGATTATFSVTPVRGAQAPVYSAPCGALPSGTTRISSAAGSPVTLCPIGIVVNAGSTLVLDASNGSLALQPENYRAGLSIDGGDIETEGTTANRRVQLDRGQGSSVLSIGEDPRYPDPSDPFRANGSAVSIAHIDINTGRLTVKAAAYLRASDMTVSGADPISVGNTPTDLEGVTVDADDSDVGASLSCDCFLRVNGLRVRDAGQTGLIVSRATDPQVSNVDIADTGSATSPALAAVVFSSVTASVGPGGDISGLTGQGDAQPEVAFGESLVTSDLAWVPIPADDATDQSLGYTGSDWGMDAGTTLTVPALATAHLGHVTLYSAQLDGTAGGSDLVNTQVSLRGSSSLRLTDDTLDCEGGDVGVSVETFPGDSAHVAINGSHVRDCARGISGEANNSPTPAISQGTVTFADSTMTNVGSGIVLSGPLSVSVSGSTLTGGSPFQGAIYDGISLNTVAIPMSATHDRIQNFDTGVIASGDAFQLHHLDVRDNGSARTFLPAVQLSGDMDLSQTGQVSDITGAGNAANAIGLTGSLSTSAAWLSPTSDPGAPLGYFLQGDLSVPAGVTLTLPKDAVVKASDTSQTTGVDPGYRGASLVLAGGSLDGSSGGAMLLPMTDPSVDTSICGRDGARSCHLGERWGGVGTSQFGSKIILVGATVRNGPVGLSNAGYNGSPTAARMTLTGDTFDHADVTDYEATSAAATNDAFKSSSLRAEGNDVTADGDTFSGICNECLSVNADGGPTQVHDDVINSMGGDEAAAFLAFEGPIGPNGDYSNISGSGRNAVVEMSANITSDATWRPANISSTPHQLGWVARSAEIIGNHTLTVPGNAIVQAANITAADGATLDATAGGITFVGWDSQMQELIDPCPGACPMTELDAGWSGRTAGNVELSTDNVFGSVDALSDVSTDPSVVTVKGSSLGGIHAQGSVVVMTDSSATGGVSVSNGSDTFTDDDLSDAPSTGVSDADSSNSTITRTTIASNGGFGLDDSRQPAPVLNCLSITGNNGGGLHTPAVSSGQDPPQLTTSDLHGNASTAGSQPTYDYQNDAAAGADNVYWGVATGPVPGQVSNPAQLTDTDPASAPVPCAGDPNQTPAAANGVQAISGPADTLYVSWSAPTESASPASYHLVASWSHNSATFDVIGSSTTAVLDGSWAAGQTVSVSVAAVDASGISRPTPSAPVVVTSSRETISNLETAEVISATNETAVPVSGRTTAGARVEVDVYSDSQFFVTKDVFADSGGNFNATVDTSGIPDGPVEVRATTVVRSHGDVINSDSAEAVAQKEACAAEISLDRLLAVNIANSGKPFVVSGTAAPDYSVNVTVTSAGGGSRTSSTYSARDGFWSEEFDPSYFADGPLTVTAVATDPTGQLTSTATGHSYKSTTRPTIDRMLAPAVTPSNQKSVRVTGTASPGGTIRLRFQQGSHETNDSTAVVNGNGGFVLRVDASSLHSGSVTAVAEEVDQAGNESARSTAVITDQTTVPTNPPRHLLAHARGRTVTLTWRSPAPRSRDVVTGYQVNYAPHGHRSETSRTAIVVRHLRRHKSYRFIVSSRNAAGVGGHSSVRVHTRAG